MNGQTVFIIYTSNILLIKNIFFKNKYRAQEKKKLENLNMYNSHVLKIIMEILKKRQLVFFK